MWHCVKGDFAHAARPSCHNSAMSRYRRPKIEGGIFFFTVVLADRSSEVLVKHVERLRQVYRAVQARLPFETNVICILPDHLQGADRVRKIALTLVPSTGASQGDFAHPTELDENGATIRNKSRW